MGGAQVLEGCPVTRVLVKDGKVGAGKTLKTGAKFLKKASARQAKDSPCFDGKVVGVETPQGKVETSRVVLAAGAWSKQLGESLLHTTR